MLNLTNVYKSYHLEKKGVLHVLNQVNLKVSKGEKIAILGRNGAGKSTLIRLIGGIELPDSGLIHSSMSISWPVGLQGGVQGSLTGLDNINFISRIYGANRRLVTEFVEDFAELGSFLKEPVKTYSAGMRGRLNFALSMAINFDCLLIDEGLSAGDSRFANKCKDLLDSKKDNAIIMVSHSEESVRKLCDKAYLLQDGRLSSFESMDEAIIAYKI